MLIATSSFPAIEPTISILYKTANSIHVSWTPSPSQVYNGRIIIYKICHKLASSRFPCEKIGFAAWNATSYVVQDLIPYTAYKFEISAGTVAGFGPPISLSATTNETGKHINTLRASLGR